MKFDILHNFISPVTGYILSDTNYVPYGNKRGIAVPSPIIIDIRLDLINLRKRYNTLSNADFVVGHSNSELPNAQVLNELADGFVYSTEGVVSTFPSIPDLPLCYTASTENLSYTYNNGDEGIGATLTDIFLGTFTIDGITPPLNSIILIKDQTNTYENGIYVLTSTGDITDDAILTRSTLYDLAPQIQSGNIVAVEYGTVNARTLWVQTQEVTLIGIDAILFIQLSFTNFLTADFVIGHANSELPNAQVLSTLANGFVYNTSGTVSTVATIPQLPLCYAASTANLTYIYNNGTDGVGATLTATFLGAFMVDGISVPLNSIILIKDQITTYQNGIYVLSITGGLSTNAVLTRSTSYDLPSQIESGDLVAVEFGTLNAQTIWVQTQNLGVIGTNAILFIQLSLAAFLPENNIWIGNNLNQPIPNPTIFLNNLPTLTTDYIWRGDIHNRPFESNSLTTAEKNIDTLNTDVSDLLTSLRNLASLVNSIVNTVQSLDNLINGVGVAFSYTALIAAVVGLELQVIDNGGDIQRLKESLGRFYQRALIPVSAENDLSYIIDRLINSVNGLGEYVRHLTVNQLPIVDNVNFNNFRAINLSNPINPQDGVTKYYVDLLSVEGTAGQIISTLGSVRVNGPNKFTLSLVPTGITPGSYTYTSLTVDTYGRITAISSGSITGSITLVGNVTGTGVLGSPITTTLALNLNEISALNLGTGNIDANHFKIVNVADPTNPLDAVNLETLTSYIPTFYTITLTGAVSGSGPSNLPIATSFNLNLNEISSLNLTSGNVDLNSFKLVNVTDPTNPQDAVTKKYVDLITVLGTIGEIISTSTLVTLNGPNEFILSLAPTGVTAGSYIYTSLTIDAFGRITSAVSGSNTISLIGPVSGSGVLGGSITTSFTLNLNGISSLNLTNGNVDLNNFKLINVANPTNPLDAVNLQTLESYIPSEFTITLKGDVIGSGPSNLPIVTTMVKTLNNINNDGDVNIKNFNVINVADPNDPLDAVNLRSLNYYFAGLKLDGFIVGNYAPGGIIRTLPGPECLLTNIQAGGNVNMDFYSIQDVPEMNGILDDTNENNAVSFAFLFKLLNDEVL